MPPGEVMATMATACAMQAVVQKVMSHSPRFGAVLVGFGDEAGLGALRGHGCEERGEQEVGHAREAEADCGGVLTREGVYV